MASRIEMFSPSIAAGVAIATPVSVPFVFNDGVVQRIEIVVPPGPSGFVGFRITHSGTVVIPYDKTSWIVTDDEKMNWDVENYPTGSAWGIQAYNTDIYAHSLYFRFFLRETGLGVTTTVPLLDIAQIAPSEEEPVTEEVV